MIQSLKNIPFQIWRTKFERKGLQDQFKPDFTRFIGVENASEYDDVLATLKKGIEEHSSLSIFFDNKIEWQADFQLIDAVKGELRGKSIEEFEQLNIKLFKNAEVNEIFLKSLKDVCQLGVEKENWTDSARDNFASKMFLYAHYFISNVDFEEISKNPKCFYYGEIARQDVYFLLLLYKMTFDVIYINPLKDSEAFEDICGGLSKVVKGKQILPINSFEQRAKEGKVISQSQSMTLEFENQLEAELFTGTGAFKPWQFRDGDTTAVFFNSNIIDLENSWGVPSRLREGFKVSGSNVYVPHFFFEVDAEHSSEQDYSKFVHALTSSDNSIVIKSEGDMLGDPLEDSQKLEFIFCQMTDGSFDAEKIKELNFYPLGKYKSSLQDFLLRKINETIADENLFNGLIDNNTEKCEFIATILTLAPNVIRLIDNFDYTGDIPKIVLFLEGEDRASRVMALVLGFLSMIGVDIVVFAPSGVSGLPKYIKENRFNSVRLDKVRYDRTFDSLQRQSKKGLFNRLRKR